MFDDGHNDMLRSQLNANVTRFAAYKAYHATQQIKQAKAEGSEPEPVLHKYNRWQATEYATIVARCRTARQFADFNSRVDLFPCLRWLPSRSASPREDHRRFWNRVWRKDDPFWQTNQPGNLWNCKCDWEETDDEPTDGNPANTIAAQGLEGNPAITGEVFSEDASYFGVSEQERLLLSKFGRDGLKNDARSTSLGITSDIGRIIIDKQSLYETAQANIMERHYWTKLEIARHFDIFVNDLQFVDTEAIDLGHNTYGSKAYKRKKKFDSMKKYILDVSGTKFIVKMGQYKDGTLSLYTIYEK